MLPNLFENGSRRTTWMSDLSVGRVEWSSSVLFRAAAQNKLHNRSPARHGALEVFFEIHLTVFRCLFVVRSDDGALSERWVIGKYFNCATVGTSALRRSRYPVSRAQGVQRRAR